MTFLAPIPAIVAAAVCVPALLALYLLRLRRRPVRVGSVLYWPESTEDVQANVPLRWLRPSWLLLLHLLALACLLLAFARPAMEGLGIAGERVVVVLDTSASMNAVDAGAAQTRLDRAKQRAKQLVKEVRSAGARSVAVLQLSAQAKPLTGFSTSPALLNAAIDNAEATDQPGNLGAALQLVDAMDQSGSDDRAGVPAGSAPPTVFLVSDGSFDLMDDLPATGARLRFERVGSTVAPGAAEPALPDNVGVLRLAARRDDRDAMLLRVFAELVWTGRGTADIPVTLALDGVPLETRVARVERPAAVPGVTHRTVLFEVHGVTQGVLTLAIARPDALACDDTASVVLGKPKQPRLLLVQPGGGVAAAQGERTPAPTWLLGDILDELHPLELVQATPAEYQRLFSEGNDRSFDLVVFDSVPITDAPRVPSICLGAVPAAWTTAGLRVLHATAAIRENSVFWDRSHPLMQGVPLDSLVVREAVDVTVDTGTTGSTPPPVVLARSDNHPLIVLVDDGGVRHVAICFDLAQSNWALTPSFAVFIANAVDELTLRARSGEGKSFATDEPVSFPAAASGPVVLEGPQRIVVREAGESRADGHDVVVSAGVLPRAGVYVVKGGGGAGGEAEGDVPRAVAVNLADEVESTLASPVSVRVQDREVGSVQPTRVPKEVWHWFVLGALGLVSLEWVVYARQVRA